MDRLLFGFKAVKALWSRNAKVWFRYFFSSITGNICNPLLFLFSFGFGLGAVVETMEGVPYMAYIVPGMLCYATMFNAGFETTIGAYSRFQTQRTYDAILATPIGLHEILIGEITWATTKALISASGVMVAAYVFDAVPAGFLALLNVVPVIIFGGIAFAAVGLFFTSIAKSYDFFNYFFTFWVTPNFLFTGVFFSLDRLPEWVQRISELIPMTHFIHVMRPLTLTGQFTLDMILPLLYILGFIILGYILAYRNLKKRLFD
jgi:lipooligosaccharide transport system permease protein